MNVGWFLTQLKRGGITDVSAVMSDRGKAFISCVPVAYPGVPHRFIYLIIRMCVYILITSYMYNCFLRRFCVKHLERNLVAASLPSRRPQVFVGVFTFLPLKFPF